MLPDAIAIRQIVFESTCVAFSLIVLPRSLTILLVTLPLSSIFFTFRFLVKGTGSFKRIHIEISSVDVTISVSIGAFSMELSIFEGSKVAVAPVDSIDKVAGALVLQIRR